MAGGFWMETTSIGTLDEMSRTGSDDREVL
jgi:hypothetical protein